LKKVPLSKRLLSYLYPVCIGQRSSEVNPVLDLFLYRNQWQLATSDALYSDGNRYRPLAIAFKVIKEHLPDIKNVLLLGTGLGSAVRMMHKIGHKVDTTLVDIDEEVMKWALELMPEEIAVNTRPVCEDAQVFLRTNEDMYDLIIVDVFLGRVVPEFVGTDDFLKKCRRRLNPGGHFILNYIVNNEDEWRAMQDVVNANFNHPKIVENGINRIIIGR
jgi:spermidine synthase